MIGQPHCGQISDWLPATILCSRDENWGSLRLAPSRSLRQLFIDWENNLLLPQASNLPRFQLIFPPSYPVTSIYSPFERMGINI